MRAEVHIWLNTDGGVGEELGDISTFVLSALTEGPANDPLNPWFKREEIEKIRVTTFIEDLFNVGTSDEEEKTKQRMEVK